jgi:voltage-gated potassium channel
MNIHRRLYVLSFLLLAVCAGGVSGFWILGRIAGRDPTLLDSLYQVVITLATVGNKTPDLADVWYGQLFIITLVMTGMGVLLVFATSVTAFFVEGEMHQIYRRKKMDKALKKLKSHIIVCGAGDTGSHVIEELLSSRKAIVIVDSSIERITRLTEQHPHDYIPYVVGQAADDDVLFKAGLARASGVVITVPDDRDALFITVTARQTNPKARIVVRAKDAVDEQRLQRAGADAVVSPARIGGMRLASEMARPQVVSFLDNMLRGQERPLRVEEICLDAGSEMIGQALRDTNLRSHDLLVLAIRDEQSGHYLYNPPPEQILEQGSTLIVLGPTDSVLKVRATISHPPQSEES